MSYLMLNVISWLSKTQGRYFNAAIAGFGYGIAVLVCAIVWW